MNLPSSSQVNAALRHGGSYGGGFITGLVILGMLPKDQSVQAVNDIQQIVDHLSAAFGAFSNLIVIIGPAIGMLMAKIASASASLKSQLKSVTTNPQIKITDGAIQAPAAIANAVPNDKVVAIKDSK